MDNYKTDIAVALIFFNRPDTLEKVFDAIKLARPSRLYLIQDGARSGNLSDNEKVHSCRKIVEHIDWECKVERDYSEINMGCGKRIFTGLSNVFSKEKYAAIVEDDIVIGESFLPFCKEMCERYITDQRVQMISGMNHIGVYNECPYSYFFAKGGGAIWGWATWARCWNELDWNLEAASNEYIRRIIPELRQGCTDGVQLLKNTIAVRNNILNGISPSFWSLHFGFYTLLNSRLHIVPKYNLISNIGLTKDSTHGGNDIKKVIRRLRPLYYAPIYNIEFPLHHPEYCIDDQYYMKMQNSIMGGRKGLMGLFELAEYLFLKILH